eukprot:47723_1
MINNQYQTAHNYNHPIPQDVIDATTISIPVKTIDINVTIPFRNTVTAIADIGSDIECVGPNVAAKYDKYIKHDTTGVRIRTGNGLITINNYLPLYIKHRNKYFTSKFWILPALPYDYLIGRSPLMMVQVNLICWIVLDI